MKGEQLEKVDRGSLEMHGGLGAIPGAGKANRVLADREEAGRGAVLPQTDVQDQPLRDSIQCPPAHGGRELGRGVAPGKGWVPWSAGVRTPSDTEGHQS